MEMISRYILFLVLCCLLCSCEIHEKDKKEISASKAHEIATKKIIKYESLLGIKAKLLPPLTMTKEDERYKFDVEDEKQNIWIVVSVSFYGEANVSSLALDEKRRNAKEAIEKYRKK